MEVKLTEIQIEDWNFSNVPDKELVACCFWEYARESVFIRELRKRCCENWQSGGLWDKELNADLTKLQSIGYSAEVFIRGFFFPQNELHRVGRCANPIPNCFPQPWQSLSKSERNDRAIIRSDRTAIPLIPFKRGERHDARDIAQWADARWREVHSAYEEVRRKYPETSEVELIQTGKLAPFSGIQPSLFYESGAEVTIVWIQWADFTNDEIVEYFRKWVKKNRPEQIAGPSGKGKKLNDWRVALTRLGIMRALHTYTFADNRFPAEFKQRGEKFCYAARKAALKKFHELFPFHAKTEKPINWQTKGHHSKS